MQKLVCEELYFNHNRLIYKVVSDVLSSRLSSGQLVERTKDITQQTFQIAIEEIKSGRMRISPVEQQRRWICRIARNLALNEIRRKTYSAEVTTDIFDMHDFADHASLDITDNMTRMETEREIRAAVSKLDERHKAAIVMKYIDGYSNAEIAKELGISISHAGVLLHRGLKKLSQLEEVRELREGQS